MFHNVVVGVALVPDLRRRAVNLCGLFSECARAMSAIARNATIAIIERVNSDDPEVRARREARDRFSCPPRTSRGMILFRRQRAPPSAAS